MIFKNIWVPLPWKGKALTLVHGFVVYIFRNSSPSNTLKGFLKSAFIREISPKIFLLQIFLEGFSNVLLTERYLQNSQV